MEDIFSLLTVFTALLPSACIGGICLYYLIRTQTIDSVLLTLGSGIGFIVSIVYQCIMPFFVLRHVSIQEVEWVYYLGTVIGFLGSLCFLTGLFLLIQKQIGKKST